MKTIYEKYFNKKEHHLAVLIDPDKNEISNLKSMAKALKQAPVDLLLIGSSLSSKNYDESIEILKQESHCDIVLFPGNAMQLSDKADALLNLSLLSGRNAEFLIGEHVRSAFRIQQLNTEIIPTAYLLIDGGTPTSVQYMSGTHPIPRNKTDIALATALAGQQLGFKSVYLETGSGAEHSVPETMINCLSEELNIPIICGGGIKSMKSVEKKWDSGANIVVIGTAFENNISFFKQK